VVSFEKLKKLDRFSNEGSKIDSSENRGNEFVVGANVKSLKAGFVKILDLNFLCLLERLNSSSCFLKKRMILRAL